MARRIRPIIVLVSAPGTLGPIDPLLRRAGIRLVRYASLRPRPIAGQPWLERLRNISNLDTVVVTSRAAVRFGVIPWRRAIGAFPGSLEFWAVGPETSAALRKAGVARIRRPRTPAAAAIAPALGRSAPRKVAYFRSNLAGTDLARALRSDGHRVVDLIVYRVDVPGRVTDRVRKALASAHLLVATSPSALSSLRRGLGARAFERLAQRLSLVVLGERSHRAAVEHGFRHIAVAPTATAQRFTRFLLQELRDGPK
jgi:uroporphyrinogen-III synthase